MSVAVTYYFGGQPRHATAGSRNQLLPVQVKGGGVEWHVWGALPGEFRASPDQAGYHLLAEEYPAFLEFMPRDARLPARYEDWYEQFAKEDEVHRRAGMRTKDVVVRHEELQAFLKRVQVRPSYAALEAYAAFIGRKEIEEEAAARAKGPSLRQRG